MDKIALNKRDMWILKNQQNIPKQRDIQTLKNNKKQQKTQNPLKSTISPHYTINISRFPPYYFPTQE
jgi:hypothetical protein